VSKETKAMADVALLLLLFVVVGVVVFLSENFCLGHGDFKINGMAVRHSMPIKNQWKKRKLKSKILNESEDSVKAKKRSFE